jgi:hypothetical protein
MHGGADSSDEDKMQEFGVLPKPKGMNDTLALKNQILMDRLIKVERKNEEMKETVDAISSN